MANPTRVAEWMWEELQKHGHITEDWVVHEIQERFGRDYVYYNNSGNLVIKDSVRKRFRQLCLGKAQWDAKEGTWRMFMRKEKN